MPELNDNELKRWEIKKSFVGWYGREGFGALKEYHPKESIGIGNGTCIITTEVENVAPHVYTMNVIPSTYYDPDIPEEDRVSNWHPISDWLLGQAVFNNEVDPWVMSSQLIELEGDQLGNPVAGDYSHVKIDITVAYDIFRKQNFRTDITWHKFEDNDPNKKLEKIRSTSYPWRDN